MVRVCEGGGWSQQAILRIAEQIFNYSRAPQLLLLVTRYRCIMQPHALQPYNDVISSELVRGSASCAARAYTLKCADAL